MKKKNINIKPQIDNQSYASKFKNNIRKENNNDINNIENNEIKINIKNNAGINFNNINDWGNIVYPNEQNINEQINKLDIKQEEINNINVPKDLLKILKEEENNENADDSEDEQLKIIQKKLRNDTSNKKVKNKININIIKHQINNNNILVNDNSLELSQIKKNENSNYEIKEEKNDINELNDINQFNNNEYILNNENINYNNNINNNNIQFQKNNNNKLNKITKNKNRKKTNTKPQNNQIMNYNLINFNSNQNQIIPPLINNPYMINNNPMMLNNPYMINPDMNNQFINNQDPYYPPLPPLPPLQQNNFPYQQFQNPYMNEYDNFDNLNFNDNYFWNEEGNQFINSNPFMSPPIVMQSNINNKIKYNNKYNNNNKNIFKPKFNKKNKVNNKYSNKSNIMNNKNNIIDNNKIQVKNKATNNNNNNIKENKTKEQIQKEIPENISEIKQEESKINININKSLESNISKTSKTDDKDKSISYQIGYLSQLKRYKQKQIQNLEDQVLNHSKLTKLKAYKKKFEDNNEIKLGKIYTTLGQKKPTKYKTTSVHRERIKLNNNKNMNTINVIVNSTNLNNTVEKNDLADIENLLQKKEQFDNQIKEIKEFIKK